MVWEEKPAWLPCCHVHWNPSLEPALGVTGDPGKHLAVAWREVVSLTEPIFPQCRLCEKHGVND